MNIRGVRNSAVLFLKSLISQFRTTLYSVMNNPPEQQYTLFQINLSRLFSLSSSITISFTLKQKYTALSSPNNLCNFLSSSHQTHDAHEYKFRKKASKITKRFNQFYKPLPSCQVTKNNLKQIKTLMCKSLLSEHISYNPLIYMPS